MEPRSPARDLLAGAQLAALNVPQALGYARIAGMPLVTGLYTLLLPLVAFAALGSSRYLVVAADSATAAILASRLADMEPAIGSARYVDLASGVALLTAVLLLAARLFRLGFLADFLSQTVLVGFLAGVGVQVGVAVLGAMLGIESTSRATLAQLAELVRGLPELHRPTLALSAAVVALVLGLRALAPRVPGALIAVVGAIAASAVFDFPALGIRVIGPVEGGLPGLGLLRIPWSDWQSLVPVASSCFLIIVAQSAATARAYAARHGDALDENRDLVGLSAANAAAGLSGAFVVNGSPTQTAMVERFGARSQLAQVGTAAVVALVLLFATGPLQRLPHGALSAIVFTIAVGLVDVRGLRDIARESPGEARLALITAAAVVALGVEPGILLAMALSLIRHVRHSYRPHLALLVAEPGGHWRSIAAVRGAQSEPGLLVVQFGADLFYANGARFAENVRALVAGAPAKVHWLVLDAGAITAVDYSAARVLRSLIEDLTRDGVTTVLVHVGPYLRADLDRHGVTPVLGADHVVDKLHVALERIRG